MAHIKEQDKMQIEIEGLKNQLNLAKGALFDIHCLCVIGMESEQHADVLFRTISKVIIATQEWMDEQ